MFWYLKAHFRQQKVNICQKTVHFVLWSGSIRRVEPIREKYLDQIGEWVCFRSKPYKMTCVQTPVWKGNLRDPSKMNSVKYAKMALLVVSHENAQKTGSNWRVSSCTAAALAQYTANSRPKGWANHGSNILQNNACSWEIWLFFGCENGTFTKK